MFCIFYLFQWLMHKWFASLIFFFAKELFFNSSFRRVAWFRDHPPDPILYFGAVIRFISIAYLTLVLIPLQMVQCVMVSLYSSLSLRISLADIRHSCVVARCEYHLLRGGLAESRHCYCRCACAAACFLHPHHAAMETWCQSCTLETRSSKGDVERVCLQGDRCFEFWSPDYTAVATRKFKGLIRWDGGSSKIVAEAWRLTQKLDFYPSFPPANPFFACLFLEATWINIGIQIFYTSQKQHWHCCSDCGFLVARCWDACCSSLCTPPCRMAFGNPSPQQPSAFVVPWLALNILIFFFSSFCVPEHAAQAV